MAGQTLLILPALDRIVQRTPFVGLKEVPDIGVVLELLIDRGLPLFLLCEDLMVCSDGIAVSLAGVGLKPLLECDVK